MLTPPPHNVTSRCHIDLFKISKFSLKISCPEQICSGAANPLAVVIDGRHVFAFEY